MTLSLSTVPNQKCARCYHVGNQLAQSIAGIMSTRLAEENPIPFRDPAKCAQIELARQQLKDQYAVALNSGIEAVHQARDCPLGEMRGNFRIREEIRAVVDETLNRCHTLTTAVMDLTSFTEKNELGKGVLDRRRVMDLLKEDFLISTLYAVSTALADFGDEEQSVRREIAASAKPIKLGYANKTTLKAIDLSCVDWSANAADTD